MGRIGGAIALLTMLFASTVVRASPQDPTIVMRPAASGTAPTRWITSWGAAQMEATGDNALPVAGPIGTTIRQTVRLSVGGIRLRVRFSNLFGKQPLVIGGAVIGRPIGTTPGLVAGSRQELRFGGRSQLTIAPGAEAYSDGLPMNAQAGDRLSISLYLPTLPVGQTGHPGARATSFLMTGNRVADDRAEGAERVTRWYFVADVEVAAARAGSTIVAIGDSITDGYGVKPDSDRRWTDTLATRMRSRPVGLVNAGIGGNRVLLDGTGPNLLARFDRDVIARSGVKWVILLEGVNDLGVLTRDAPASVDAHAAMVARVTEAYRQLVARAHAHGIKVMGGTIMPLVGNDYYHAGAQTEADRQAINAFIRTSGVFDAVVDFDRLTRDPARPDRLAVRYDSGDHLHPSEAGYAAMGAAIPVELFDNGAGMVRPRYRRPTPRPSRSLR